MDSYKTQLKGGAQGTTIGAACLDVLSAEYWRRCGYVALFVLSPILKTVWLLCPFSLSVHLHTAHMNLVAKAHVRLIPLKQLWRCLYLPMLMHSSYHSFLPCS